MIGKRLWSLFLVLLTPLLLWCGLPGGGSTPWLLTFALVPFFIVIARAKKKQALQYGLLFGTIHYMLTMYWIVTVLGKYGALPTFITVPALILLAFYLGIYVGLFSLCGRLLFSSFSSLFTLFAIPTLWVGLDWLRGTSFTGLPWMDIGYGLSSMPTLIQVADLFGHNALSWLVVWVNCLLALIWLQRDTLSQLKSSVFATVMLALLVSGYSYYSWQRVLEKSANSETMVIGIVQGNIDQSEKWSPDNQGRTMDNYRRGSDKLFKDGTELLVWPETALPFYPQTYKELYTLQQLTAEYDTGLLTGAPWFEIVDRETRKINYYNSALLMDTRGEFTDYYYKSHLVPFGEYVPLGNVLTFLAPLVEGAGNFTAGTVNSPLEWKNAKVGILICYESIFSDIARKWINNGANVLVNLTNDAWYGKSSAPYQSMAMSVFRAVETRRTVVRSANTGISGFIDPLGRVAQPSPLFTEWAQAKKVSLRNGETVFVRGGYLFAPFCLILGILLTLYAHFRERKLQ